MLTKGRIFIPRKDTLLFSSMMFWKSNIYLKTIFRGFIELNKSVGHWRHKRNPYLCYLVNHRLFMILIVIYFIHSNSSMPKNILLYQAHKWLFKIFRILDVNFKRTEVWSCYRNLLIHQLWLISLSHMTGSSGITTCCSWIHSEAPWFYSESLTSRDNCIVQ